MQSSFHNDGHGAERSMSRTLLVRLAVGAIVVFACAAPGCAHRKWQGPSDFYKALDAMEQRDGSVRQSEWAAMYDACLERAPSPQCAWMFAEWMAEFTCMDRDFDGGVSWSEYYDVRFINAHECPALNHLMRQRPAFTLAGQLSAEAPERARKQP